MSKIPRIGVALCANAAPGVGAGCVLRTAGMGDTFTAVWTLPTQVAVALTRCAAVAVLKITS